MAKSGSPDNKDEDDKDDRDPFAIGYAKAIEVMSVCVEAALPILLGALVDLWLGTVMLFMFLGLLLGSYVGYTELMKVIKR